MSIDAEGKHIRWADPAEDEAVALHVAQAMADGGLLVVPGGSTPRPILARLADLPLPWARIAVTLTDDREVPHSHPASNFGALRNALGRTGASLRCLEEGGAPGHARLVWVGMGADGHVASIFPNVALDPSNPPAVVRTAPDPLPPEAPFTRVTLNYRALANTDEMILVARGWEKKRLIDEALAGAADLPIGRLLAMAVPITIFWRP